MRILSILFGLIMVVSCYALKIMSIETPYINEADLKLQASLDARLPVESHAVAGAVSKHTVSLAGLPDSIYIIGDDPLSKQWLISHKTLLQKIHSIGFVTNISSASNFQSLEKLAGTPLLPANVDDLLKILKESHYPFIFHKGVVWQ